MRITLKDIAARAGVSKSLVSMYLNHRDSARLLPATRLRIDQAVQELGYRPSFAAQALAHGATRTLGFVVSGVRDPYFAAMLDTILQVADERGYQLTIFATRHDPEREKHALDALIRSQVDGIIFQPQLDLTRPEIAALGQRHFPLILIGQNPAGWASAYSDARAAIDQAVAWARQQGAPMLTPLGFNRPGFLEALQEACQLHNLTCTGEPVPDGPLWRRRAFAEILRRRPPWLLIGSCWVAQSLLRHIAEQHLNYAPRIITVHHFDCDPVTAAPIAGVIHCDFDRLIRGAVQALIDQIENPRPEFFASHTGPAEFIPRPEFTRLKENSNYFTSNAKEVLP